MTHLGSLLAAGQTSVPHHLGLSISYLGVLMVWWVASPRQLTRSESSQHRIQSFYSLHLEVKCHCFCHVLLSRSESRNPACIQRCDYIHTGIIGLAQSSLPYSLLTRIPTCGIHELWQQWTNSHGLQKSCGEKGMAWPLSKWEWGQECQREPKRAWPLPGQAFIAFLSTLHRGWSSFTMHRFAVGDWLPFTDKERMLLITSKRRMLQIKGESGWTGYTPYLGGLAQTLGS